MRKILLPLFIFTLLLDADAQLAVGTVRKTVTTDTNGWVINNPIGFSNQVSMVVAATNNNQLVRYQELTNTVTAITNIYPLATTRGGTGAQTTQLPGNWTNTINFTVGGTNNANAYRVQGVLGFTGSISNLGATVGTTNVDVYATGILTNKFTIP